MLECEVPDESVPSAWYLEDQRLMPSTKYGIEQKGTKRRLTIHDVGTDDDGVYLCEMPDGAKSIAELSVKGMQYFFDLLIIKGKKLGEYSVCFTGSPLMKSCFVLGGKDEGSKQK